MATEERFLSSVVNVSRRFQRSTKLDSDLKESRSLDGFILQNSGLECLRVMANHVSETSQRAFTWTGSYGTGKSTLALFLASLLGPQGPLKEVSTKILAKKDISDVVRQTFVTNTSYRIKTLIGHKGNLAEDFISLINPQAKDYREAIQTFIATAKNGLSGALLVIDELGKYLEGGNADNCYFLQELAEAVNSSKASVIVLGILHQSFDAYANQLSQVERDEWAKVQGRFVDIPFLSGADEVLQLLDESIQVREDYAKPDIHQAILETIDQISKDHRIDVPTFQKTFNGVYPLNPVTATLLGNLTRQSFLQNTRSVFSFLTSREPKGFQEFLSTTPITNQAVLYSPVLLWDYLQTNFDQAIRASSTLGHRWAIAVNCLERAEKLTNIYARPVLKCLAVLDLFKAGTGLAPNSLTLSASLWPLSRSDIKTALQQLEDAKIIIFRKYLHAYSLFEGSDFNLEKEIKKALQRIEAVDISAIQNLLNLKPVIARRHYAETGTMRWFSREVCDARSLKSYLDQKPSDINASGRLLLLLVDHELAQEEKETILSQLDSTSLVATVLPQDRLVALAKEIIALQNIGRDPQVDGDRVARQEILLRYDNIRLALSAELEKIFTRTIWSSKTLGDIQVASLTELNGVLSKLCNQVFSAAPKINNELINRGQLSGNISHAVKKLITAMVYHSKEERLAITGYPPEAMIYASLLKASGAHRCIDTSQGLWGFSTEQLLANGIEDNNFNRFWSATSEFFSSHEKPSLQDLYDFWAVEPFGLKMGVRPILAMAYFLANRSRLSVYVNEAFEPDLSDVLILTWYTDPKNIKFRYVPTTTDRSTLLQELFTSIHHIAPELSELTALDISRAIVRIVLTCPKWALNTNQLTERTKEFRTAVIKAWDPLELVFQELPRIFKTNDARVIASQTLKALQEIQHVTPDMLDRLRHYLMKALDADGDVEKIHERASAIRGTAGQITLEAFISRLMIYRNNDASIEGIISLAVAKPKAQWTDRDIDACMVKLADWALAFRHLESIGNLKNQPSSRRMISLVVSGEKGVANRTLDIKKGNDEKVVKATQALSAVLNNFPDNVALAALIEQSIRYINKTE